MSNVMQNMFYYLIEKPSMFIQKHFIFSLFIIILTCFIITLILFTNDEKNTENPNFNRNYNIEIIDDKEIKKFVSSPFTDAMHYTLTTFSSVGYGDITPLSSSAKAWTNIMQFFVILMSLKLFEYIYTDKSSLQSLYKQNTELSSTISKLTIENDQLKKINDEIIQKPLVTEFAKKLLSKIKHD